MSRSLRTLLAGLDRFRDPISHEELIHRVRGADLGLDDVRPFVRFSHNAYQRNLVHVGPAYEALVLCWKPGQQSAIHDHAGSACCVRVLSGTATETVYDVWSGRSVYPVSSRQFHEGDVCGSFDSDIHAVANRDVHGRDLVTLHIYSRPLRGMNTYAIADSEVLRLMAPATGGPWRLASAG